MTILLNLNGIWLLVNLAVPAWLLWRRSPHFRHRVYHLTIGSLSPSRERELAHSLIETGRHQRGRLR
jgi:hypothetical protein